MAAKKTSDDNGAVNFRPGEVFGRLLARFVADWNVSRNEAGKRLAVLAAYQFSAIDYAAVAEVAGVVGGAQDFVLAAHQLRVALDSANRARQELRKEPLNEQERAEFLRKTVQAAVEGKEPAPPAEPPTDQAAGNSTFRPQARRDVRI